MKLRPYQKEAIAAIFAQWETGNKRTLVSMPTGTGKTWIYVAIAFYAKTQGMRTLILVHTNELANQAVEKLRRIGIYPGLVKAQFDDWQKRNVTVASVQTLRQRSRLWNIPRNFFGIVVTDECHMSVAKTWQTILWYFSEVCHVGLTATGFRTDGRSLTEAGWQSIAYIYSTADAVRDGWLAPYRIVSMHSDTDLSRVPVRPAGDGRDYETRSLQKRVNTEARNTAIVRSYMKESVGRKTLVFTAGIEHAVAMANSFRRVGLESFAVYHTMGERKRASIIQAHQEGRFPILTNVGILTHGYDDPSISSIVMARPTLSKVLYLQCVGRGLRPEKGKTDCLILDVIDRDDRQSFAVGSELDELKSQMG